MKLHLPLLLLSAVMSVAMLPAAAETSDETLIVNAGETVILENKHSLDVEVQKDATLQFSGNDMFSYDEGRVGQKFKVSGGTVDFGTTRQTFTKYTMCLSDGATLMGVGQTGDGTGGTVAGVEYGAIDVIDGNMLIEATSGSNTISAWTRLRRTGEYDDPYGVEYKVADTAVLTVSGKFIGEGNITKSGAGTMYLSSSEASLRSITVSEGSLEIQSGTYTVSGGIFGTSIAMGTTGEVALTLTGGTVSALLTGKAEVVIAGNVTYNQANTYTGTTTVNQGKTLYLNLGADAQGNDQVYEVKGSMMGAGALQIARGTNAVIKDTAVALDVVTRVYGALTFDLEEGKEYKLSNDRLQTKSNLGDESHLYKTGAGTLTFTKDLTSCGSFVHVDEGVLKLDLGTNSAGENQVFNARNSYKGNGILQVESGTTFNVAAGSHIEPDIRMNGGHAVFDISGGGEYELRGSLSGNGEIKKKGAGILVFKDAVDYSGTLEIEAGSLKFDLGAAEDGSNREIWFAGGLSASGTRKVLMVQEGTTLTLTEKDAYTQFSYELNGGALKFVGIKEVISSPEMSNTGLVILGEGTSFTAGGRSYSHDFVLDGGNAEFGSREQALSGNVTVNEGSTLTFTGTDALDYGITRTLTVNAGGTVNFDGGSGTDKGTRQTMDGWTIVLNGGTLVGSGQVINEVNYGSIDYADYENASTKKPLTYHKICAESGESTLSAGIRLRGMNVGVEFKVDDDATLTVDKAIMLIAGESGDKSSAGIVKTGKGELIFETDHAFSGTTKVQAGTLSLDTKGVYDLDGNVTGDGTLSVKSGTELQLGNYSVSTATTKLEQGASITSGSEMKISGGTMNHVTVANGSVTGAADEWEWARLAGVRIELLNDAALVLSDVGLLFGTEVVGSSVASGVTPVAESALNKVELLRTTLEIRLPETGKVVNPVDDILPDDFAIVLDDATDATGYAFSYSAFQGVELSGELVLSFSMDNVHSILDSGYDYLVITFSESVLTDLEVFAWFEPADTLISATVSGNSVYISTPAVPESSTATLSLLALLGLCTRRRRK